MNKIKVLFLCTSNSARSQMAEAFLKKYGGDRFEAYSAGLKIKPINPYTKIVMDEIGVSLEGHRSNHLNKYLGKMHFGYLITVCDQANKQCPTVFPSMGQRLHWSFEDPAAFKGTQEEKLLKFRAVRDQIEKRVQLWLSEKGR